MALLELKLLIVAQIVIDLIILALFFYLMRKFRSVRQGAMAGKWAELFEGLLSDADRVADEFKTQLEEKHRLIRRLNEQLDRRIISLNLLLNRSHVVLSSLRDKGDGAPPMPLSIVNQQAEIIKMASEGHGTEEIAKALSIPEGEVRLVLDLRKKLSQWDEKEREV